MKPRGARKPSAFVFCVRISWLLRRMSVNLAEAIQTKHVITFGLVALSTNGSFYELLPGNGNASDGGIFCAGLTL
jgi:hypothetical protein